MSVDVCMVYCVHFTFKMENLMRFTCLFVIESPVLTRSQIRYIVAVPVFFVAFMLLCIRMLFPARVFSYTIWSLFQVWFQVPDHVTSRCVCFLKFRLKRQHIVKWQQHSATSHGLYTWVKYKDARATDEMSPKKQRFQSAYASEQPIQPTDRPTERMTEHNWILFETEYGNSKQYQTISYAQFVSLPTNSHSLSVCAMNNVV